MPYVNAPPGLRKLTFADGGPPAVANREGGRIWVSDRRAKMIDSMDGNGTAGLVSASFKEYGSSSKPGRVCTRPGCNFVGYGFTMTCPRTGCGAPTRPEGEACDT